MSDATNAERRPDDDHPQGTSRSTPWRRGRVLALRDKVAQDAYVVDAGEVAESIIQAAHELLPVPPAAPEPEPQRSPRRPRPNP